VKHATSWAWSDNSSTNTASTTRHREEMGEAKETNIGASERWRRRRRCGVVEDGISEGQVSRVDEWMGG